jgi:hypothetical protein
MTKQLALLLLACCPAGATTYTVNPGQSTSAIQRIINRASSGDTVSFAAGTYNITAGITLKCGATYTAATPATPSNVILNASFATESADIFTLAANCTRPTTVSYLSSLNAGFLFTNVPNTGLTVTHNQVGNLPCCANGLYDAALYFQASNNTVALTNATVTWNQFGDVTSCTRPTNGLLDYTETIAGACSGIQTFASVNGLTVESNKFFHLGEGVHINCSGSCEPPSAYTTSNITVEFNDFNQIHRMAWEQQPQPTSGIAFQNNSMHDWINPYAVSFGISFACCATGTNSPFLNVSNNVLLFNTTPTNLRYGFGIEAWGLNAVYNNNWLGTGNFSQGAPGITWGYGPPSLINNNTICGTGFNIPGWIVREFGNSGPNIPTQAGNVTAATCSAKPSIAPTISPSTGPQTFPLTVTLTDAGYTSGAQPLGNTGIWYTTDGSTPVPGSGTAQYLASGGTFVLPAPATVKAVGMWGSGANPTSYAPGYGFVPSAVKSAHYAGEGAGKPEAEGKQRRPR